MQKTIRVLSFLLLISIIVISLHYIYDNAVEWWDGAGDLFDLVARLAEAYVVSFIFFLVIEIIPHMKRKKLAVLNSEIVLYRILKSMDYLLTSLLRAFSISFKNDKDCITVEDISAIENSPGIDMGTLKHGIAYIGDNFNILNGLPQNIALRFLITPIYKNIDRILNNREFYDLELIQILEVARSSSLLETIETCVDIPSNQVIGDILNIRKNEIKIFYTVYRELHDIMSKLEYPVTYVELKAKH